MVSSPVEYVARFLDICDDFKNLGEIRLQIPEHREDYLGLVRNILITNQGPSLQGDGGICQGFHHSHLHPDHHRHKSLRNLQW